MFITTKGRTVKVSGFPIIRVPNGKICLIKGFIVQNNEIIKKGEVILKTYNGPFLLEFEKCKFNEKD